MLGCGSQARASFNRGMPSEHYLERGAPFEGLYALLYLYVSPSCHRTRWRSSGLNPRSLLTPLLYARRWLAQSSLPSSSSRRKCFFLTLDFIPNQVKLGKPETYTTHPTRGKEAREDGGSRTHYPRLCRPSPAPVQVHLHHSHSTTQDYHTVSRVATRFFC